jgi:hypothetical protein
MLGPVHKFCGLSCDTSEIGADFYCMNEQDCCLKTVVIMVREIEELVVGENVIKYRLRRKGKTITFQKRGMSSPLADVWNGTSRV